MKKKRRTYRIRKWVWWVAGCFFCGIAGFILYQLWTAREDRYIQYREFGINIPLQYSIHGIDVSWHQGRINWGMVKSMNVRGVQLEFAFMKATEGLGKVDVEFRRNWSRARDVGIVRGAYHFFLATKSGREQAENFLGTVDFSTGDLPPVLDVEETYGVRDTLVRSRVREWLDVVQNSVGVRPIIYTNVDFYRRHLGSTFDGYPLWVAHYLQADTPRIDRSWFFWQHSESGRVSGVGSGVDFDVFQGDSLGFKQLLIP